MFLFWVIKAFWGGGFMTPRGLEWPLSLFFPAEWASGGLSPVAQGGRLFPQQGWAGGGEWLTFPQPLPLWSQDGLSSLMGF